MWGEWSHRPERLMGGKRRFSTILANKNSLQDIKCHTIKSIEDFEIHSEALHPLKSVHGALIAFCVWLRGGTSGGGPIFRSWVHMCLCRNVTEFLDLWTVRVHHGGSGHLLHPKCL